MPHTACRSLRWVSGVHGGPLVDPITLIMDNMLTGPVPALTTPWGRAAADEMHEQHHPPLRRTLRTVLSRTTLVLGIPAAVHRSSHHLPQNNSQVGRDVNEGSLFAAPRGHSLGTLRVVYEGSASQGLAEASIHDPGTRALAGAPPQWAASSPFQRCVPPPPPPPAPRCLC